MSVTISGASKSKGVIQVNSRVYPKGKYVFKVEKAEYKERADRDLHAFEHKFLIEEGQKRESGKSTEGKYYMWWNNVPMQSHEKFSQEWFDNAMDAEVMLFNAAGITIANDVLPVDELVGKTVVAILDIYKNRKTGEDENIITAFEVDKG